MVTSCSPHVRPLVTAEMARRTDCPCRSRLYNEKASLCHRREGDSERALPLVMTLQTWKSKVGSFSPLARVGKSKRTAKVVTFPSAAA
jgi:hypothetical protein